VDGILRARDFFSDMPLEVFQIWIVPAVKRYGWEGVSIDELLQEEWQGFFAGYPISFWKSANWQLCSTPFDINLFAPLSIQRAIWIVDYATKGLKTPCADIHDTAERFWACAAFIEDNRKLPCPLIGCLTPDSSQIDLVDGHHRLAAAMCLGTTETSKLPIWIARPK
jgi:hypothetical protein